MKLFFTTRDMDEICFGMQLYSDHRRSVQVQRKSLTLKYPDLYLNKKVLKILRTHLERPLVSKNSEGTAWIIFSLIDISGNNHLKTQYLESYRKVNFTCTPMSRTFYL